ncbi:MAG: response regulator [Verrucomicrobia bacterium]|nr:response regulator [Verrucomicrobiota bacterium]
MKFDAAFVLENANWPALLVDAASTILRANQAAVKTFGPALEGATPLLSAIWSPENGGTAEQFLAQWERAPASPATLRFRVKGGGMASFSTSICSFAKEAERWFILQLLPEPIRGEQSAGDTVVLHKQKLDCALQMARTVALDFNNALTSILGYSSLLLSKAEANHPWRRALMEMEKSAAKAAEIANDLAEFSRQDKEIRGQPAGNLNTVLQRCVETFQNSGREPATWRLQLERRLFAAKFDEAKIQQAFVKILENSVESFKGGGRISVQTRNVELAEPTQDRNVKLAAGTYVCAEVSDNGEGIAPDILPRVFEPFFTTKPAPHRGLGLAWVYGIVTNHGGGVAVSSQPGAGTSVRIYLPAEKDFVRDGGQFVGDLTGNQTVLMVDDEDLLLTMGDTILSSYGYTVYTANSGQKALDIISKSDKPIDLVITDLVMPVMSGRELVERIRQISPGTRILCATGYVRPGLGQERAAYLQKPFTSQELLTRVKQALLAEATVVD